MKKLFVIVFIAALVSCGSKKEGNQDLTGKKAALETLTKQRDELNNHCKVKYPPKMYPMLRLEEWVDK